MRIFIYTKLHEQLDDFTKMLDSIKHEEDELYVTSENRRAFQLFNDMMRKVNKEDVIGISSLKSLGTNDADVAVQLTWFIERGIRLVICEIPSTYEFGVSTPVNQAVLSTILQSVLNKDNIVAASFKRSNCGRNKLPFPDNWDELYDQWTQRKITSKKFIELSGLKKATFYNLMTEYKEIQNANEQFLKRYGC